jgi:hypothetical protein
MQPHLPFAPRQAFVDRFAPVVNENADAAEYIRGHNSNALRWMLPLTAPLSELQAQTLSDMYDAEVAYQDHLLADLLSLLQEPWHLDNTMVVIVSDHGEMLGEHQLTGHGLGAYQELAHVPLIIRWPGQTNGRTVARTVSTRRVFHSVLAAAGLGSDLIGADPGVQPRHLSLDGLLQPIGDVDDPVFCEAYPPETLLQLMEANVPSLIETLHARVPVRALYGNGLKLIEIEDRITLAYDLHQDPQELCELGDMMDTTQRQTLTMELKRLVAQSFSRQPANWTRETADLSDDKVRDRLRGLGYMA